MIEQVIFANLLNDEQYARKALPFIKTDYFQGRLDKVLYDVIAQFVIKYNKIPTKEALMIEADNQPSLSDDECAKLKDQVAAIEPKPVDLDWLLDETEKFCQDKAVYNAIFKSIGILDGKSTDGKGAIPQILSEALAISFDTHIGHDFLEDAESRYEFYHKKEKRVAFDLDFFNRVTKGGVPNKTLNIILAGTGVGKSLAMCHMAAANLTKGLNVLYITMEMAEERIAERVDANLLNTSLDELEIMPLDVYQKKMNRVRETTKGKLIVKEYPTSSAGSANFRHLLNELKLKRNFKPDIIYIDYLNICASSRIKNSGNVNSYTYIKAIAEELRGLAVEFDVPIWSATQTTRSGFSNSDVGLEDTSESFGLPATADFMIALISTDELAQLNQILVKQLKNRYASPDMNKKFVIGVDKSKMKLYDVEQHAQDDIISEDKPAFDRTDSGKRMGQEKKFDKDKFKGFN